MGSPIVISRAPAAALIGGGFIGPVHVEALRRIGVEVVGLLGSSPDRASGTARAAGDPARLSRSRRALGDRARRGRSRCLAEWHHFEQTRTGSRIGPARDLRETAGDVDREDGDLAVAGRVAAGAGGRRQLQHPLLPALPRDPRADRRRRAGPRSQCHRLVRSGLAALPRRL